MDALEVSYNVLRIQYLTAAGEAFCSAKTWQAAEAALFALRFVLWSPVTVYLNNFPHHDHCSLDHTMLLRNPLGPKL